MWIIDFLLSMLNRLPSGVIELAVLEVIGAVGVRDLPEDVARVPDGDDIGGDVLGHHATRADHDVVVDRYLWADGDVTADPDVITNRDRDAVLVARVAGGRVDRVTGHQEIDLGAKQACQLLANHHGRLLGRAQRP